MKSFRPSVPLCPPTAAVPLCLALAFLACSDDPTPPIVQNSSGGLVQDASPTPDDAGVLPEASPNPGGPGPAPTKPLNVTKDDKGFFKLNSARSDYVVRLPVDYDAANPRPYPMVVGMHGCGDNAYNFGTWAVTTFDGRPKQDYIAISIGGRDGQCWSTPADEQIVFAAIEDVRQYIYAHDRKITLAGFSSGGSLAYYMGLKYADRFAGLLVQHSAIPGRANAIKNAPRKIAIAATGAMSDNFFPPATYNADWSALRAAGFPLETREKPGGHDGTSDEWRDFLLPKVAGFAAP